MLTNFLISRFIKNYKDTDDEGVRQKYGYLAGVVGIFANILLSSIKLTVGFISHSIAITADAFNNLSDAASSLITVVSFKLANKPADKEHPFGHGRVEYLAALVVSFFVMMVGFQFVKTSFDRIVNPTKINFQIIPFILLLFSILVKVWLGFFNKKLGKKINSTTLSATSMDAFSDVITTSVVALSFVISNFTSLPIDGYIGILVALFIIYSGFSLVKETINPLLGEAPDAELVENIQKDLLSYEYITGVHDIIVHNYGPSKFMVSLHAEVPCDISILKIHEIIDRAEKEMSKKHNILLVIHMDPINTNNKEVQKCKDHVISVLNTIPEIESMHDFRMVGENEYINLIFDVVVDHDIHIDQKKEDEIILQIDKKLKAINPAYNCLITIDKNYTFIR
ncbi:cation diffusion facilitator family transporter [Haloimpatiens lingqiaonensis]|uniref:cation diffusion facilitator family transporter n=1 Tax=Haloimpatiens lingqiaonensis TaxID=1380675 RepID=UPI0010FF1231|nr:cation diffusion facilitator family transporter [Haloimpatiens lingqiaonensis]